MTEPVTILMPVGPNYNPEWLYEAIDSAIYQTYTINELFIVADGSKIEHPSNYIDYAIQWLEPFPGKCGKKTWYGYDDMPSISLVQLPINLGFRSAFNLGMAISNCELVMFLASDDKLMPEAVERAVATWEANNKKDAWYPCTYQNQNGDICAIANNLAMTTKHFFLDMCGGYPPAAFVGPDAALLSCLMVHAPDRIIKVDEGTPLYWIRDHDQQETKIHTWKYVEEMNSIRGKLTAEFKFKDD